MPKIAVLSDSTANLPAAEVSAHEIQLVPLKIHWGDETYLDGVTLDSDTFYRWLEQRTDSPHTSQPASGEFARVYRDLAARTGAEQIVGIFVSSEISGTYGSAVQGAAQCPELDITVIDSRSVSMGLGFQVLAAARLAQAGAGREEIVARIRALQAEIQVLFAVDTLEYLRRGGRIGRAARLLGTVLSLKPVLAIEGGEVTALAKVRSRRKSLQTLVDLAERRLAGRQLAEVAVLDIGAPTDAAWLSEQVRMRLGVAEIHRTTITPVLGAHAGPHTVELAFYPQL